MSQKFVCYNYLTTDKNSTRLACDSMIPKIFEQHNFDSQNNHDNDIM